MVRLLCLLPLLFFSTVPAFGLEVPGAIQALRARIEQSGPRGAVSDRYEYWIHEDRILYRQATGPSDEPYREVKLPGGGLRMAATNDQVYVWIHGAVLNYAVGQHGLTEPALVLASEDPAALAALQRQASPTLTPSSRSEVVITPQRLLVANMGGGVSPTGVSGDSITGINVVANQVIATGPLSAGDSPQLVAVLPNNGKAFTSNYGCSTCINRGFGVVDPQTLNKTATITPGRIPFALGVSNDGTRLIGSDGTSVLAFDTGIHSLQGQVDVGLPVQDLVISSDSKTVYAVSSSATTGVNKVTVHSATNVALLKTYAVQGTDCFSIAISPDDKRLAIACTKNPSIVILDAATGNLVTSMPSTPSFGLTYSPDGKRLYVSHVDTNAVEILDTVTNTRIKQIGVQSAPSRITVNKTGNRGYVSNTLASSVSVLDLVADAVIANLPVGPLPFGSALTTPAPNLIVQPAQLNFTAKAGQANPEPQNLALSLDQGTGDWTVVTRTLSGGNWLSASQASGTFPFTLVVSVNTSGLAVGAYNGTITVTAPNTQGSPQAISVALQITASGTLALSTQQLTFESVAGGPAPSSQTVNITGSSGTMNWAAVVTGGNAPWLSLGAASGTTPGTLTVSVNPQGFPAGRLEATVSISSTDASNSPQTFKVVYTIGAGPAVPAGGVVNAASFAQGVAVAPGALVSIFGSNFGVTSPVGASSLPLPTTLGNVKVTMGGFAAPLVFVSASQINCQVPYELAGQTTTSVVVQAGTASSAPSTMALAASAPGIFTATLSGRTQGAILNKDSSLNTPANPAKAGEIVQIFATGPGPLANTPKSGEAAPGSPLATTVTNPVVLIGGKAAEVVFSGLTPGLVGLWQINVVIPADVTPGDAVTVQVQHGGVSSNTTILAVAQ